jgi:AraC family transcriptional regulator, regulatory protein of adaptative response / DNA-3-methyladenine glycosylase II
MKFGAVVTTGIYCRPGCGASPSPGHVTSFPTAAAAESAGYRACLRCRPYRYPQPLGWDESELVCRAVRLILGGVLDGHGEEALGPRVGVSCRHLRRIFAAHLGVTPDGLARSCRAHFARRLIDDTDLPISQIAFAAGYGSIRQLNRSFRQVFRATPSELRARRRVSDRLVADGGLPLRLSFRGSVDWPLLVRWLAGARIPGVEHADGEIYRRTIVIDGDPGVLEFMPGDAQSLRLVAHLPHWGRLIHIVSRARRVAALDDDPDQPPACLAADPVIGPLIRTRPGVRVPGTWDPFETAVVAIVRELHPGRTATAIMAGLASRLGRAVPGLRQLGLTHTFPLPRELAGADLTAVADGMAPTAAAAVGRFAGAVAAGLIRLDGSIGLDELVKVIVQTAGVTPATAHYIAWRMGERDAFPLAALGIAAPAGGAAWRPWRALAAAQLAASREEPAGACGNAGGRYSRAGKPECR